MSEKEHIERLRQLLKKSKLISYSKIYQYVDVLSANLKDYVQKVLKEKPNYKYHKGNIEKYFKDDSVKNTKKDFQKYFINSTSEYPFYPHPQTSVISKFIRTPDKDTDLKSLFSLYFGYAGWEGFKENKTIADVFNINEEIEQALFSKMIVYVKGKKSIETKIAEIRPSFDTLKVLNEIDSVEKSVADNKKSDDKSNDKTFKTKEITEYKEVSDEKINPPTDNKKNTQENEQTVPELGEKKSTELGNRNEEDSKENQKDKKRKKIVYPMIFLIGILGIVFGYIHFTNSNTPYKPKEPNPTSLPDSTNQSSVPDSTKITKIKPPNKKGVKNKEVKNKKEQVEIITHTKVLSIDFYKSLDPLARVYYYMKKEEGYYVSLSVEDASITLTLKNGKKEEFSFNKIPNHPSNKFLNMERGLMLGEHDMINYIRTNGKTTSPNSKDKRGYIIKKEKDAIDKLYSKYSNQFWVTKKEASLLKGVFIPKVLEVHYMNGEIIAFTYNAKSIDPLDKFINREEGIKFTEKEMESLILNKTKRK